MLSTGRDSRCVNGVNAFFCLPDPTLRVDDTARLALLGQLQRAHVGAEGVVVFLDGDEVFQILPPEDIGGVVGYAEFLDAIADPSHEDHEHYLDWIGGDFDPDAFDIEKVNVYLTNLARR